MIGTLLIATALLVPSGTFQKDLAWKHLQKQCEFGARVPGTTAHTSCRDYILAETKAQCDVARLQSFTHKWSETGKTLDLDNIIGEQNWKDAKIRVVLTTHWDSRPYADQDPILQNQSKPVMGANDGGSGVAVLLELMHALKGKLKDVGVMYVITDGEDLGPGIDEMLLGAAYFAKNLPTPKPNYGILLDMIGDKDLRVPVESYSLQVAKGLTSAFYGYMKEIKLDSTFPYVRGEWITDDHKPLNEAGIPTLDLIDFDYAPWHTANDTIDKCSAESLGKVGLALESWLLKDKPYKP
jgi:hypothetical protein